MEIFQGSRKFHAFEGFAISEGVVPKLKNFKRGQEKFDDFLTWKFPEGGCGVGRVICGVGGGVVSCKEMERFPKGISCHGTSSTGTVFPRGSRKIGNFLGFVVNLNNLKGDK